MLEGIEADELHSYCTRFDNKMLNKRSIPKEKKEKKPVVAKCRIESKDTLQHSSGKDRFKTSKKYKRCGIMAAMQSMTSSQSEERDRLFTPFEQ